jgi:hypothetical protein
MSNTYSFWQFINLYKIEIPLIQRDYAQGRRNKKVESIKQDFIATLLDALINNKPTTLDFIYGNIKNDKLIPIDGQQRLTALWLLHWYLINKEDYKDLNWQKTLSKFNYIIRPASKMFFEKLVNLKLSTKLIENSVNISDLIENENWFFKAWKKDPTVSSVLNVLNEIHSRLKGKQHEFMSLLVNDRCPISFEFLPLEEYGLSDNLYIKMNSRGEPLTVYENLKAKLLQLCDGKFEKASNQINDNIDGNGPHFFGYMNVSY